MKRVRTRYPEGTKAEMWGPVWFHPRAGLAYCLDEFVKVGKELERMLDERIQRIEAKRRGSR